jgi:hypothetical protein
VGIGLLLATWGGGATPDRSEANPGTPLMQFRMESGAIACTPLPYPTKCIVGTGGTFDLAVAVVDFPPGGYTVATAEYDWTGTSLVFTKRANMFEVPWPQRGNVITTNTVESPTRVEVGDLSTGAGATPSTFKGDVIEFRFTCSAGASSNLISMPPTSAENPKGGGLADSAATIFPQSDSIAINCVVKQPEPGDTDGDGCSDQRESGTNPFMGGRRNYNYFWDFYDTPDGNNMRDRLITTTGDILRVALRFGANDMGGIAPVNRNSDPLAGPPPPVPGYHPAFDRSIPIDADPWDLGPPDGTISVVVDVLGVANQFFHDCR